MIEKKTFFRSMNSNVHLSLETRKSPKNWDRPRLEMFSSTIRLIFLPLYHLNRLIIQSLKWFSKLYFYCWDPLGCMLTDALFPVSQHKYTMFIQCLFQRQQRPTNISAKKIQKGNQACCDSNLRSHLKRLIGAP